ncbi:hypothetical protein M427DRAFT_49548 [Gonapodya prolifera JEL478]|uniref:Protein artemis n=1 Tax=Gonapodya prolifera (strain JEL478) TaxID=1344416 RepID=A0A138ZY28_GONPJ|nr:hypothetical protein M427DRAFT_49548 [Gonapodya prolifera JEL478]|eukprot:KXS09408.1 hypothetical protein M427DRAFT_49548 [Gonapodya prolifera JEL478]
MSTFDGRIREIPSIRVDNFARSQSVTAFLLSHAHADHTAGIDSARITVPIYCTHVTAALLEHAKLATCPETRKMLRPLEYGIAYNDLPGLPRHTTLTLFSANHCPGAAMFLLDTLAPTPSSSSSPHEVTVLYTGDCRADSDFLSRLVSGGLEGGCFLDHFGRVRRIDALYLDTSFADKCWGEFPKRSQSIRSLLNHLRPLLHPPPLSSGSRSRIRVAHLQASGLGCQELWEALGNGLGEKIHVSPGTLSLYKTLLTRQPPLVDPSLPSDLLRHLTSDHQARIHACGWCSTCTDAAKRGEMLHVKPTTMAWGGYAPDADMVGTTSEEERGGWRKGKLGEKMRKGAEWWFEKGRQFVKGGIAVDSFKVLYSHHSSPVELTRLVSRLQPLHLYPCVLDSRDPHLHARALGAMFAPYLRKDGIREQTTEVQVQSNHGASPSRRETADGTEHRRKAVEYSPDREVEELLARLHAPPPPKSISSERTQPEMEDTTTTQSDVLGEDDVTVQPESKAGVGRDAFSGEVVVIDSQTTNDALSQSDGSDTEPDVSDEDVQRDVRRGEDQDLAHGEAGLNEEKNRIVLHYDVESSVEGGVDGFAENGKADCSRQDPSHQQRNPTSGKSDARCENAPNLAGISVPQGSAASHMSRNDQAMNATPTPCRVDRTFRASCHSQSWSGRSPSKSAAPPLPASINQLYGCRGSVTAQTELPQKRQRSCSPDFPPLDEVTPASPNASVGRSEVERLVTSWHGVFKKERTSGERIAVGVEFGLLGPILVDGPNPGYSL